MAGVLCGEEVAGLDELVGVVAEPVAPEDVLPVEGDGAADPFPAALPAPLAPEAGVPEAGGRFAACSS